MTNQEVDINIITQYIKDWCSSNNVAFKKVIKYNVIKKGIGIEFTRTTQTSEKWTVDDFRIMSFKEYNTRLSKKREDKIDKILKIENPT